MKVVVTATGEGLDAPTSPIFGRSQFLVLVETDTLECETLSNPAISASGGAGIQAAQFLTGHGVHALVTGNVGPNAFQVLSAANVPVYLFSGSTNTIVPACSAQSAMRASCIASRLRSSLTESAKGERSGICGLPNTGTKISPTAPNSPAQSRILWISSNACSRTAMFGSNTDPRYPAHMLLTLIDLPRRALTTSRLFSRMLLPPSSTPAKPYRSSLSNRSDKVFPETNPS